MYAPELKGHEALRARLAERLVVGRLSGTLLFAGPEAVGKRRVALELARRELCFRRTACGACEGCRAFLREPLPQELPNLLHIAPEGKAGLIRVAVVRDDDLVEGGVITWAHQAPPPGCHRWILVEDAHRLNGHAANMLLKTLEEPPPDCHFILVTHRPDAMLPTIRSRAERIAFAPLPDTALWEVARERGWAESDRDRWCALAGGSFRFLDPEAFAQACAQVEAWLHLAAGIPFTEAAAPLLPNRNAPQAQSEQLAQALERLLAVLADLNRLRAGKAPRLAAWREALARTAQGPLALKPAMDATFHALHHLVRNPNGESLLREVALALRG